MQSIFESTAVEGESLFLSKHSSVLVNENDLFIMDSNIRSAGKGVFAKKTIEKDAFLGVMSGKRVAENHEGNYVLEGGDFTVDAQEIPSEAYIWSVFLQKIPLLAALN